MLQDRLYQEVVERQRRSSSKVEDMNSIRAMTRRYRQTRGDTAAASSKPINKRELKGATTAVPLRQVSRERERKGGENGRVLAPSSHPHPSCRFRRARWRRISSL